MALREYLTSEVAEDWADGLLSRREALRRLVLLGMSVSAAAAFLAMSRTGARSASPETSSSPGGSPGAVPSADSSASASAGPVVAGTTITFPGPRGELLAHLSEADAPRGAMLVIHENRGLTDHIRSVADRLAGAGYTALAIDLLSEEGGTDALGGEGAVGGALGAASDERFVEDMRAGLDELQRRVPGARLGIVGFCFGGAMVWTLLDAGEPRLSAAIPFYGPAPDAPDFTGNSAAVLGVYAELDERVNASQERARAALQAAALVHQINVYPGAGHGFFNDTGGRYDASQAAVAWSDVLDWLGRHLAAAPASPAPSTSPSPVP